MTDISIIKILDQLVFDPQNLTILLQKTLTARQILDQIPDQITAFVLVETDLLGPDLPAEIKSSRVFVIRAGASNHHHCTPIDLEITP